MRRSTAVAAGAGCVFALAGAAMGDILAGSESITEAGQVFVFDFAGVGASVGEGILTIEALGDYSVVPPSSETLTWDVDGIATDIGFNADAFSGTIDLFQNHVVQSWVISASDMAAITADGMVTVTLTNSSAVGFFVDQPEDFVSFTLEYPVPAPAGLALLGLGGLAASRRRR